MKLAPPQIVKAFAPLLLLIASVSAFAQTATMISSDNWDNASAWQSSNVGDLITENIQINANVNPTLWNGPSGTGLTYTVGDMDLAQDNNFTIDNLSTLNVGQSGTPKNFTTHLNPVITANGTLEIWGNFIANNNVTLNISGTVHIHGNMNFSGAGTSATVNGSGHLIIDGDMTGGGNVNFTVNGAVEVFGNVSVGSGSNLNGGGTFLIHGACSGSPFCSSGILPVELLYFRSRNTPINVELAWATASGLDLDYFLVERSLDGKVFHEIGRVISLGDPNSEQVYTFVDEKPAAGTSFFRLSEVTHDGAKKTLSTLKNIYDAGREVYIAPNPIVKDQPLSFSLNFKSSQPHEISVFDVRGVLMTRAVMQGSEATLPLDLGAGVYIVRVTSSEFSSVQRIVVQ